MRIAGWVFAIVLILGTACGRTPGSASISPNPQSPTASSPSEGVSANSSSPPAQPSSGSPPSPPSLPSATPAPGAWSIASSYGLIEWANAFGLVNTGGSVTASFPMSPPSVVYCYGRQQVASLEPPISATRDTIFFRDGDTRIRALAPDGSVSDVTTVPGGAQVVSFFSVSPDDQRIAVLVEDVSNPVATLRLYVENLRGGGNHVDLLTTTASQGAAGDTIWPIGWHSGALVVALTAICTPPDAFTAPSEFRLLDTSSGQLVADVTGPCTLSAWPSPAGVMCVGMGGTTARVIDWTGSAAAVTAYSSSGLSGLSPSGDKYFLATSVAASAQYFTSIVRRNSGVSTPVNEHAACLWIDNDHLMAPNAVIDATIGDMGFPKGTVSPIAQRGACAGRFPGGL